MKICLLALFLGACAGQYVPPYSVTAGFFGASVTVSQPGFTVPAKVVQTASVVAPTLMVPANAPVTGGVVPITTSAGATEKVPVIVAPVSTPIFAIPNSALTS